MAANAISTLHTQLMVKGKFTITENTGAVTFDDSVTTYDKVVDIKSDPDIGSGINMLESTTLSDEAQTFVPGIKQLGDGLTFTCNYTLENYRKLAEIERIELEYAIWYGENKENGYVTWSGQLVPTISGGGVDEVREISITISNSDTPEWHDAST